MIASEGTLFRVDSVVTKMWVTFAGIEAQSYLSLMLRDGVRKCTYKAPSFEVNPRKLSATDMATLRIRKQQLLRSGATLAAGGPPYGTIGSDGRYRLSQNPAPLTNLIDGLLDDSDDEENDPTRPKHATRYPPSNTPSAPSPRDISVDRLQRRNTAERVQMAALRSGGPGPSSPKSDGRLRTDTDVSLADADPSRGHRGLTEVIEDNYLPSGGVLQPAYTLQGAAATLRAILPVTRPVTRQLSGGLGITIPANDAAATLAAGQRDRDDDSPNTTPVPTSHRIVPPPEVTGPIGASRLPPAKPGSITSGSAAPAKTPTSSSTTTTTITAPTTTIGNVAPLPVTAGPRHTTSLPANVPRSTTPPSSNNSTPRSGVVAAAIAAANNSNNSISNNAGPNAPSTPTAPNRKPPPRPDGVASPSTSFPPGGITTPTTTTGVGAKAATTTTPTTTTSGGGTAGSTPSKAPIRSAPIAPGMANSTMSVDRASFGLPVQPRNPPLTSLFSQPLSPSSPPPSSSPTSSTTSSLSSSPSLAGATTTTAAAVRLLPSPSKSDPLHVFSREKKLNDEAIRQAGGVIDPIPESSGASIEETRKRNELRERRREEMLRQESRRMAKEMREQAAGTGKKFTWETVVAPGHYPKERKEGRKTLVDLVWRKAEEERRVVAAREVAAEAGRIEGLLEEEQAIQNAAALEHATAIVLDGIIRSLPYAPMYVVGYFDHYLYLYRTTLLMIS
jgi:hypothetical protein